MSEPSRPLAAPYNDTPVDFPEPSRELPEHATPSASSRLNETAGAIGSAVGAAIEGVRELPRRLQGMKKQFTVIRGRTRAEASSAAAELKETAEQKMAQARTRARHLAHDYPVELILGVAASAFVLGFVLRIWRSNRA